jgi:long-chain acyl-CoA synthetase
MEFRKLLINRLGWDRNAIFDEDETIEYGALAQRSFAIRAKLTEDVGSNIALLLPNSADYIAALFGIIMGGFTVFPLNTTLTEYEIEALLIQTKVKAIVTSKEFNPILDKLNNPPKLIYVENIESCAPCEPSEVAVDPNAPMVLLTTSGTSGKAKIVMLSERNLIDCVTNYVDKLHHIGGEPNRRYLVCVPFYSVFGVFVLFTIVMRRYAIALMREPFTLDAFYRKIERYKITNCETGTAAIALMAQNSHRRIPYDISSACRYGFGGSAINKEALEKLYTAFPWAQFWNGYGMSESSGMISKVNKILYADKLASVGTAMKNMQIMIEADGVMTDAPFVRGEVVTKGSNVMLGYYENESETAKTIQDGWLHTGDVGYFDEDKYLYICGRIKNIILVRGFTVYAEEVEACILSSGLARECSVYAQPDKLDNERVRADVVPIDSGVALEDILKWCSAHIAPYKCPEQVSLIASLDKTDTGKIKRRR